MQWLGVCVCVCVRESVGEKRWRRTTYLISFYLTRKKMRDPFNPVSSGASTWHSKKRDNKTEKANAMCSKHMDRCNIKSATRNKCNIRLFLPILSMCVCVIALALTKIHTARAHTHTRNITALQIIRSINSK